jgi:hypothetical protein
VKWDPRIVRMNQCTAIRVSNSQKGGAARNASVYAARSFTTHSHRVTSGSVEHTTRYCPWSERYHARLRPHLREKRSPMLSISRSCTGASLRFLIEPTRSFTRQKQRIRMHSVDRWSSCASSTCLSSMYRTQEAICRFKARVSLSVVRRLREHQHHCVRDISGRAHPLPAG